MSVIYNVVLVLHIVAVILGFGIYLSASLRHTRALKCTASDAHTIFETSLAVTKVGTIAIALTLPLGIVLVSLSGADGSGVEPIGFGALWISLSFVLWFAMMGVVGALITKNVKGAAVRVGQLDPGAGVSDDPEAVSFLQKVGLGDGILQLMLVVMIGLMIWQPTL